MRLPKRTFWLIAHLKFEARGQMLSVDINTTVKWLGVTVVEILNFVLMKINKKYTCILNCWIKIRHDQNKGGVCLKNLRCSWWVVLLLVYIICNRDICFLCSVGTSVFRCVAKFKSGTFNSTKSNKNGDLPNWDNIEAFDETLIPW